MTFQPDGLCAERVAERRGDGRTGGGQLNKGLVDSQLEALGLGSAADCVSDEAPANYFQSDCTSSSPSHSFAARFLSFSGAASEQLQL